ncbi:PAS domain-containing protein [Microcoleus vaginatus]|uniref:PAS domain-containing protein n=1 Tax=Microcoleus vaginatus TaxID=119532 RepID=UPI00403F8DD1
MQIDISIPSETLSPARTGGTPNLIEEVFRLYDRALAATSNGIAIADATRPDKPIVYCNGAFERITGYDRSEIIGQKLPLPARPGYRWRCRRSNPCGPERTA